MGKRWTDGYNPTHMRRLIPVLVLLFLASSAFATTRTWTGTTSGQWTLASNWGGTAPVAGDDLVFPPGALNLNNTNDFPAGTVFHSIAINGGGSVLNGNQIVLTGGMSNSFTGTSTINLSIQLSVPLFFFETFNQSNGALVIAGNIDLNGCELSVTPALGSSVTISGAISGGPPDPALHSNVSVLKGDSGDLTLSGNNTFAGQVLVGGSGRLLVASANALGVGDNTLANGTVVNSGAALAIVGVTVPNEFMQIGGVLQSLLPGSAINGTVKLGDTMSVLAPATLAFNGLLTGISFRMGGDGTYIINSTGNTFGSVAWFGPATLRLGVSNALPSTVSLLLPTNALFDVNGKAQTITSLGGVGNVSLGSGGALTITNAIGGFAGAVSGSGSVTLAAASSTTWTGANTFTGSFSHTGGEFDLSGGSLAAAFTQSAGTFGIGENATAGAVTINGGVFWPNGTFPIANTGNLTLAAGTTYREDIHSSSNAGTVNVTGTVSLGGATLLLDDTGALVFPGNTFTIIDNDGADPVIGTFNGLPQGAIITGGLSGLLYRISYVGGTGNDVVLTALAPGAIPALDPRALAALALALAAIAMLALRR